MRQKETEMTKHVVPPQKFGACFLKREFLWTSFMTSKPGIHLITGAENLMHW